METIFREPSTPHTHSTYTPQPRFNSSGLRDGIDPCAQISQAHNEYTQIFWVIIPGGLLPPLSTPSPFTPYCWPSAPNPNNKPAAKPDFDTSTERQGKSACTYMARHETQHSHAPTLDLPQNPHIANTNTPAAASAPGSAR